jgi:nucleotide-binding universal stress UspA family protein
MRSVKSIVAATDLSPLSLEAVDRGFLVAETTGAHYTVFHALGLDAAGPLRGLLGARAASVTEAARKHVQQQLDGTVADGARTHGVTADVMVTSGLPGVVIPDFVAAHDVDLLVVGAHGSGFSHRLLFGSTAHRLLRKSPSPVLVVKARPRGSYSRVLVALDFSPASLETIHVARAIAPDAEIVLLHVLTFPLKAQMRYAGVGEGLIEEYRQQTTRRGHAQLADLVASSRLPSGQLTSHVVTGDPGSQTLLHGSRHECNLVVLGKHGANITDELLFGSVTKHVLAGAESDVLVVVDRRRP